MAVNINNGISGISDGIERPYGLAIARSYFPEARRFTIVGTNPNVDNVLEDLITTGGTYVPPSSAMQMEVVSSSASDSGSVLITRTASGGSQTTLVDAGATFIASGVAVGDFVINTTKKSSAVILTVDSETQVTLAHPLINDNSSFQNGDGYKIIDKSAGGTGAQVVSVYYLDANYDEQYEIVILNGVTAVSTAATNILRVNKIQSIFNGTGGITAGNIDIRHLSDTPIYRRITAGLNVDEHSFFTVPRNHTCYISAWQISAGSATPHYVSAKLRATCDDFDEWRPDMFFIKDLLTVQNGGGYIPVTIPYKIPAKSDIKITVISDANNANVVAAGLVEGFLIEG